MISVCPWPGRPGFNRVIPKTQKMVLDAALLNTQHYKVRIKSKVQQSRERSSTSPTPWCSSYRKERLRVTLDNGRQLYFYFPLVIYCYFCWRSSKSKSLKVTVFSILIDFNDAVSRN